jgi:hypothetical protein
MNESKSIQEFLQIHGEKIADLKSYSGDNMDFWHISDDLIFLSIQVYKPWTRGKNYELGKFYRIKDIQGILKVRERNFKTGELTFYEPKY